MTTCTVTTAGALPGYSSMLPSLSRAVSCIRNVAKQSLIFTCLKDTRFLAIVAFLDYILMPITFAPGRGQCFALTLIVTTIHTKKCIAKTMRPVQNLPTFLHSFWTHFVKNEFYERGVGHVNTCFACSRSGKVSAQVYFATRDRHSLQAGVGVDSWRTAVFTRERVERKMRHFENIQNCEQKATFVLVRWVSFFFDHGKKKVFFCFSFVKKSFFYFSSEKKISFCFF